MNGASPALKVVPSDTTQVSASSRKSHSLNDALKALQVRTREAATRAFDGNEYEGPLHGYAWAYRALWTALMTADLSADALDEIINRIENAELLEKAS